MKTEQPEPVLLALFFDHIKILGFNLLGGRLRKKMSMNIKRQLNYAKEDGI